MDRLQGCIRLMLLQCGCAGLKAPEAFLVIDAGAKPLLYRASLLEVKSLEAKRLRSLAASSLLDLH